MTEWILVPMSCAVAAGALAWSMYRRIEPKPAREAAPVKRTRENRGEFRIEAEEPVTVTLLGEHSERFPGTLCNVSSRGLQLSVDRPLPLDAPLRIDVGISCLLAEVHYCVQRNDKYVVGAVFSELLTNTQGHSQWFRAG
jgi:hypothetical protein